MALAVIAGLAVSVLAEVIVRTDLRAPAQGGSETHDATAALVAATSLLASLAGWVASPSWNE